MGATFTAKARFVAQDKTSRVLFKMGSAANNFAKRTSAAFARVERQGRRIQKTFSKLLGVVGKLGLGFGALMIAQSIAAANIELDKSLASLSAITGKTGAQFELFEAQVKSVAKQQLLFAGDTAKAFEVVASAQPILLGNAKALGKVTNAAITLSKASGDDLAASALSLTGVMNQFSLGAEHAERVMNSLAAGSVAGSANISNVAASMKNFGAVAASANLNVEQSIALVEVMGSKSIFAEDAGNKLKASILNLQAAGLGYQSGLFNISDALTEVKTKVDAARTAKQKDKIVTDVFKKTGIATGQILLNNIGLFESLTKEVTGTTTAVTQMNIKANTFENRLAEISASFKNAITATDGQGDSMQQLKDIMAKVALNMDKIIGFAITAVKVFLAFKVAILATVVAQKAMVVAMAIGKFVQFISVVMAIAKAQGIWTAAQWALNFAMNANPIGLIVLGIAALATGIFFLIKNWSSLVAWIKESDNWFARLIRFSLKPIIWLFQGIQKGWVAIKSAFASGTIGEGIKKIGKILLAFLLAPVEAILFAINKISFGKFGGDALAKIAGIRDNLLADETGGEKEIINTTKAAASQENISREERITNNKASININNNTDSKITTDIPSSFPLSLSPTN